MTKLNSYKMTHIKATISFLLFLPFLTLAQVSKTSKSSIEKVIMFRDRAEVTSNLKTSVSQGVSKIEIPDLASTIDGNSISVSGKGAFTLLSVDFLKDFIGKRTLALKDSISVVEEAIEVLRVEKDALEMQEKMVMDNTEIKSETEDLYKDDLEEMSNYFRKKISEIGKEKLFLKRKIKELEERKANLENQIKTDPSRNLPLGKIFLTVKADQSTTAELTIKYIVYNTGWRPMYDLRLANTQSPVELTQKAIVYQNTGVDWNNVRLVLSTAPVNKNGIKPELYPQYLSFYEPRPIPMMAKSSRAMAAPQAEGMVVNEMADMETAANYSEVFEKTLNVEYDITLPYTVKSGSEETVEVQKQSIPAKYVTYLVPKSDKNGFLVAEEKAWEQYNLMPAEANVYFEGTFIGKSYVQLQANEDDLKISLGRDERIISERKEIKDYKSKRTFGSNIRESFGYEIIIRNTKNEAVNIVVEDQLPVSQNSDIEVTVEEASGAKVDAETGKLNWEINIPAAQSKTLMLKYEVKYPKDKQINNL